MIDTLRLTAQQANDLLQTGEASSDEIFSAYRAAIDERDGELNCFLHVSDDAPGEGIPIAHKDLVSTKGIPTTAGSKILEGYVPVFDATVAERCQERGLRVIGKTNMDEFAMGSSTENSAYGPTRNPWDPDRVPGGSSGGSAAAVAGGLAAGAFGTDTGGSVRQPAAFCGVVGLKPTYGRVSRYGLIAFASSLDHVAPFALDIVDTALLLGAVAGHDPLDATSVEVPVPDYAAALAGGVKGLKVGVPDEYFGAGLDPEIEGAVRAAIDVLRDLGATIERVSLPTTGYGVATYYIVAPAEASSNLARYDVVKYGLRVPGKDLIDMVSRTRAAGFGAEVKRRIMLGTYALSTGYYDAYYGQAQKVRTLVRREFEAAFARVDLLAAPTTPGVAFKHGDKADPLAMYMNDVYTIPASMTGLPAVSVPCGFNASGLPIGLQLIGRALDEATLLRAAHAYEQATPWRQRRPDLS